MKYKILKKIGITTDLIHWQLSPKELETHTLEKKMGRLTDTGALAIYTGAFTGRSPKDRFIVKDALTQDKVWWDGVINQSFDSDDFDKLYQKLVAYLSDKELYVRDGFVCADPKYRLNIRTVNEYPWSNLFAHNMFMRLSEQQLGAFEPDWLILNAPGFLADPKTDKTRQGNFSILNISKKIALIGGSAYTGEMKKGIFSVLNFILPTEHNVFPMHCSANVGDNGQTAIFFGLSGTGKTTLSADPNRKLIGDDEHGWTPENTVFNFEGGCYAKVIDLTEEKEPDIYRAIKEGALLENVMFKEGSLEVDYSNDSVTPNTRVSYPIEQIKNIQNPSIGDNPKHIFFLTFDAFGVLPPLAKLNLQQAAYYFMLGYTSKVAGTEVGIITPKTTFSTCFGAPFMPLHPSVYAKMLQEKVNKSGAQVWLVNTGLNGYGKRMALSHTRAIISAALAGFFDKSDFEMHSTFGFLIPTSTSLQNVPKEVFDPQSSWSDKEAYKDKCLELGKKFNENFMKFGLSKEDPIALAGPRLNES